ncbi:MAG TPA: helix-turn-helix domain-containing protein [Chloroflexi bacterium]|nr:helix-turn-helix domain-containing protein [Chloroflexota bacterium]
MPEDLWKIRKRKGMSVSQLAARSGIAGDVIREYESGGRAIPSGDLRRLARALYVGEWDINPRSSPPPRREERPAPVVEKAPPRKPKPKKKRRPPPAVPARETQITHMLALAARFGLDRATLEGEIGKPLDQLATTEARKWNRHFMERLIKERPPKRPIDRRRAYLPEGVDGFEMDYLEKAKASGVLLTFTLFNGERHQGVLVGYGPYTITISQADGSELTLNKLAIAYYRCMGGGE